VDIALCQESVLPAKGGAETYVVDLMRRLVADRHQVHLYASAWEQAAVPAAVAVHAVPVSDAPRWLRPWRFGSACLKELSRRRHDVTIGLNKTWGQDVLYPQGGLHAASAEHNARKYRQAWVRFPARWLRRLDLANLSYLLLERRQYLSRRPIIIANSNMVRSHFQHYYNIPPERVRIVRSAIDPARFVEDDRPRRRLQWRKEWNLEPGDIVGLFIGMNYRLKGLEPLLYAVRRLPKGEPFRLLIAGDSDTDSWQKLARRLEVSDRVRFIGYSSDARNCYFASDFLCHPTFYDPCSLVVLEALACGLPVITSCYNGASELMSPPHDGYVVTDPHDDVHLAWCIERMFDPVRRARCAQAARRQARSWTFEHHYRALMDVLTEATGRRQAA
jgi:UDP-glucose:(heptosyl)LPS alpha-1,3-glucosyltransferase